MKNSNEQSNDPFTKLANILENLKIFVNNGKYSQAGFKQEVEKQFESIDSSDETALYFKKNLKNFCSTKSEALKTISGLQSMVKPISTQVSYGQMLQVLLMSIWQKLKKAFFIQSKKENSNQAFTRLEFFSKISI